jgi:hypothetical protein
MPGLPTGSAKTTAAESSGTGPAAIWKALENAGASPIQAAGIMGNWIAESSLNPEADVVDSNGYRSVGLAQFNEASYPNAGSLVTGHPAKDIVSQVNFFVQTGGLRAAQGSTPAQVAGNVAANYERCQTCGGTGSSGNSSQLAREGYASQVAGWAASGNWPTTYNQAADTAVLTNAQTASGSQECAWQIGWGGIPGTSWLSDLFGSGGNVGSGSVCLLSKTQARAVLGAGMLIAGGVVAIFGIALVSVLVNEKKLAAIASAVPGVGAVAGVAGKAGAAAPAPGKVPGTSARSAAGTTPPPAPARKATPPPTTQGHGGRRISGDVKPPPARRTGGRTSQGSKSS